MWSPPLLSLITSAHQAKAATRTPDRPAKNRAALPSDSRVVAIGPASGPTMPFIHTTAPTIMIVTAIEAISGQGLGFTR